MRTGRLYALNLALPVALFLGVVAMFAAMQRQLIYFPTTASEAVLLAEASTAGLEPWRGSGGIIGWRPAGDSPAARRMLVFHGNAGYALHRAYYPEGLRGVDGGWEVVLFEYPGYGARAGKPSADGIKAAASEALEALLAEDERPVYLLGESLGSGVASYLAGEFPDRVAGVLLVTPFTRLADVASHHYPFLPVRTLLSERYDSVEALGSYRGPVAFLVAGRDEVVPAELGRALHDGYSGPKWVRIEPDAGHNTLPVHRGAAWWGEASGFLVRGELPGEGED